jgi:hypothetical protein
MDIHAPAISDPVVYREKGRVSGFAETTTFLSGGRAQMR